MKKIQNYFLKKRKNKMFKIIVKMIEITIDVPIGKKK